MIIALLNERHCPFGQVMITVETFSAKYRCSYLNVNGSCTGKGPTSNGCDAKMKRRGSARFFVLAACSS